jgi:homoserine dehydrogenase
MRADLVLVGFGNVGRRFARLLQEQRHRLLTDYDLDVRIVGIATRRHGMAVSRQGGIDGLQAADLVEAGRSLGDDLLQVLGNRKVTSQTVDTDTPDLAGTPDSEARSESCLVLERLASSDAELRVLVETTTLNIRNGRPAIDHVERALRAGCHVVTANKGPVAFAHRHLTSLAERHGVSFLFEGSVMDGIPVFNLVRETLPAVNVLGFRGVVNSTTNHILTALENGEEFAPALERMQVAGIAEADPSLDLEGWDAAAKAAALANVLLDADVTPHDVDRTGLTAEAAGLARNAFVRGNRLRLVASARRGERPIVRPVELPPTDLLAGLRGMANALVLETELLGELAIVQLEGSLTQTAYALFTDLVTIARRHRAPTATHRDRSP